MSSFSIDMDDPREAWESLYREIEAAAAPVAEGEAGPESEVGPGGRAEGGLERSSPVPAEDLVGWLWLMHACWIDDSS